MNKTAIFVSFIFLLLVGLFGLTKKGHAAMSMTNNSGKTIMPMHKLSMPMPTQKTTEPSGHAPFHLSPNAQQLIGVKIGWVIKRDLNKNIDAAGRIAYDPELYTAQTEYIEALQELEQVKNSPLSEVKESARQMVNSARLRLKILGLSDRQIAHLHSRSAETSNLLLTKPHQHVWVYADIFEMDLPYVKPGERADISADFLEGKTLIGKVISVDRVIDTKSRTARARILVNEGTSYLRPGSYVNVTIHDPTGDQVVVPFDAILNTGKAAWVFVVKRPGIFIPRKVGIKFYDGNNVAIASGLTSGENIVTSANFLIDSESRLKASEFSRASQTPSCPKNQHWDTAMTMCMPN